MTQDVDLVNHPPHYRQGKIEAIEFFDKFLPDGSVFNAMKYLIRFNRKDNPKQDLGKALWYIQHVRELQDRYGQEYCLCQKPENVGHLGLEDICGLFDCPLLVAVTLGHLINACKYNVGSISKGHIIDAQEALTYLIKRTS